MNPRPLAIIGSTLLVAVFLTACGSDPTPTPTPTATPGPTAAPTPTLTLTPTPGVDVGPLDGMSDAEIEYLDAIRSINGVMDEAMDSISEALQTTWPTRERLLDVLGEADISVIFDATRGQVEQLDPPDTFDSDHDRFLEFIRGTGPLLREHDQAVEDGDLVAIFTTRAHSLVARERLIRSASAPFCLTLTSQDEAASTTLVCDPSQSLPGGEHGVAVHAALDQYSGEFNPRVSSFPPIFTPEELYASLASLNPEIEVVIQETRDLLEILEPLAEFQGDHDRLIQYLDENLGTAQAITSAAKAQGEAKLRDELFPESGDVFCAAQRDFSEEFRPLIAAYFGDEVPPQCR